MRPAAHARGDATSKMVSRNHHPDGPGYDRSRFQQFDVAVGMTFLRNDRHAGFRCLHADGSAGGIVEHVFIHRGYKKIPSTLYRLQFLLLADVKHKSTFLTHRSRLNGSVLLFFLI
jgi:hypothetical protein